MKYWFLIAVSCACARSWADARSDLSLHLAELNHLAADFTQRIEDADGEPIEESSGFVRLLPPNFRWEVTAPHAQVLVAANDELRLYDPDLEQVTVRPLKEVLEDTPLALLTRRTALLGDDYEVEWRAARGENPVPHGTSFSVRPRAEDALFDEIVLTFGDAGLLGIRIRDHLGQRILIRFHGLQDASVIQSADFELIVPPGTDVY